MIRDIDRKKLVKNGWRITSKRNFSCLRVRVPGGHLDAKHLDLLKKIAEQYGNGTLHITTRQGFEIPGIPFEKIKEVNELLTGYITETEIDRGVTIKTPREGYPSAGTRNVSACIGNRVCPYANYDTTALALKVEALVYPNDYHVKIALTGCPNDCIKAHMQDIGVLGQVEPLYDQSMCIGCEACVKTCANRVTKALSFENRTIKRDPQRCIGCGECILACPTQAMHRNPKKFYRVVIMGRTGKKNPRLAAPFAEWLTEEPLLKIIQNVYPYINQFIDKSLPKEHVGYIVDRTGYQVFREWVLRDVELNPEAKVAKTIQWQGYTYGNGLTS